MKISLKKNKVILTKNTAGIENGFLVPIYNELENFVHPAQKPRQIYLTVCKPKTVKGPHLHKKRWGMFTCIKGNVKIVCKTDQNYEEYFTGEDFEFNTIQVPAGIPNALVNIGDNDAYILNMPSPAWAPNMNDDWDIEFGDYNFEF